MIGAHITITNELARTVGSLAGQYRDRAVSISYDDGSPEDIWTVELDSGAHSIYFAVNDETGAYTQLRDERQLYGLAELEALPTLAQGQSDNLKVQTEDMRVWLCRGGVADRAPYDDQVMVERLINGTWTIVTKYRAV